VAGAIVYWRAGDRQRSRELAAEVDDGIREGRNAANALLTGTGDDSPPFDQH
jgi:hypothetical protein